MKSRDLHRSAARSHTQAAKGESPRYHSRVSHLHSRLAEGDQENMDRAAVAMGGRSDVSGMMAVESGGRTGVPDLMRPDSGYDADVAGMLPPANRTDNRRQIENVLAGASTDRYDDTAAPTGYMMPQAIRQMRSGRGLPGGGIM